MSDEEGQMLEKYEEADLRVGMTKLVIIQPAVLTDELWEPELSFLCASGDGYEGFNAGCSFASIDECISWAKEELGKKQNYNRFGKPDNEIIVEIYKPIEYKRIKIA